MSEPAFFDQKPRVLRRYAWIAFFLAAVAFASVLVTLLTGAPEWNRFDRLGDGAGCALVGMLFRDLANARERQ